MPLLLGAQLTLHWGQVNSLRASVAAGCVARSCLVQAAKTSGEPFAHTAEPHHYAPHVGLEHVTRGNARVPPDDSAPGAAARHPILSCDWALRVEFRTVAVISYGMPVLHPFPDVPQRVIQSKSVRLFSPTGWVLPPELSRDQTRPFALCAGKK